jgi:FSR family fosmidomycin resistance protein-like MFS transporter
MPRRSQRLPRMPLGPHLGSTLVVLAHFANDAATSMFPAVLPSLATRFQLEPSDLALLVTVFAVSTSLPQPLFGLVADRLGGRWVGALGLAVTAAFVAGLALAPSMPWLWGALFMGGLGSAALHPAGMGLARASSAERPGLAVAVFSSAGMAGGALGPLLAIGVAAAWGFEQVAWVALPVLMVSVLLGRSSTPRTTTPGSKHSLASALRLFKGRVAWLALVALLANVVMLAFTSGVPVWLVAERGLAETAPVIGVTLAVFSLAAAVGGVLGGILERRQPPRRLIVGSLAFSAFALQGVFFTDPGSVAYVVAVAMSGALLGLNGPLLIARAQELTPGAESATAGVLLGATSAAAGLIYACLGAAQAAFGIGPTLSVVSLLVLPAAHLAAVTLARPSRERCGAVCSRSFGCCAELVAAT